MKKLLFLFCIIALISSCKQNDITDKDSSQNELTSKEKEGSNTSSTSKDTLGANPAMYYFAGYEISKTAGSDKLFMNIAQKAPDNVSFLYISGKSFVNQYGATYTHNEKDNSIKNTELFTTQMAAVDPAVNKAEAEFYDNLRAATKIVFEEKQVKLIVGTPTKEVLIFKKK